MVCSHAFPKLVCCSLAAAKLQARNLPCSLWASQECTVQSGNLHVLRLANILYVLWDYVAPLPGVLRRSYAMSSPRQPVASLTLTIYPPLESAPPAASTFDVSQEVECQTGPDTLGCFTLYLGSGRLAAAAYMG